MPSTPLTSGAPLGEGVRNTPLSQKLSASWEVIPFVGDEMIRALAWHAYTRRMWYPKAIEHTSKLGACVSLSGRENHRKWPAFAIAGEMDLGGKASTASSERFL